MLLSEEVSWSCQRWLCISGPHGCTRRSIAEPSLPFLPLPCTLFNQAGLKWVFFFFFGRFLSFSLYLSSFLSFHTSPSSSLATCPRGLSPSPPWGLQKGGLSCTPPQPTVPLHGHGSPSPQPPGQHRAGGDHGAGGRREERSMRGVKSSNMHIKLVACSLQDLPLPFSAGLRT